MFGFACKGKRASVEKEDVPAEVGRHGQIISQLERRGKGRGTRRKRRHNKEKKEKNEKKENKETTEKKEKIITKRKKE